MKIFAQVTNEGIAMSETALCVTDLANDTVRAKFTCTIDAESHEQLNDATFRDCTGNETLECQQCGATANDPGFHVQIHGQYGDSDGSIHLFNDDEEVVMWDSAEWAEDPSLVFVIANAILTGCIQGYLVKPS